MDCCNWREVDLSCIELALKCKKDEEKKHKSHSCLYGERSGAYEREEIGIWKFELSVTLFVCLNYIINNGERSAQERGKRSRASKRRSSAAAKPCSTTEPIAKEIPIALICEKHRSNEQVKVHIRPPGRR